MHSHLFFSVARLTHRAHISRNLIARTDVVEGGTHCVANATIYWPVARWFGAVHMVAAPAGRALWCRFTR